MSEWLGECCWCGVEVEIFDHGACPAHAVTDCFDEFGPQPV